MTAAQRSVAAVLRGRKSRLVPEGADYIGGPSIAAGGASLAAAQDRQ